MQKHNLQQGSAAWHNHRSNHFNASDAPAMLGVSQYKTRSQLLQEMATGISQEFDAATERRFADGHRFEALARPLAEKIIGEELYPVTASEGKLSASFDGLTMDESICFEHKSLNDTLRAAFAAGQIPEQYCAQMEQQIMISGATKCLFMASKFDANDELVEEIHIWYESDQAMRDRIVHGWVQFSKDLENYTPPEVTEKPVADAIMGLPAVSIQATGMITASNLPEFKKAAETFIANIKTELVTDEDFSNAEANVKFCKTAEDDLEGTKKAILAQTTTIDEAIKTIDYIKAQLATKRLMLDKLVKSEKESRKLAIISKAGIDFSAHVESLESETRPIQLNITRPDFAGAIKGLKKLSAMQEAIDTVLRDGKFAADNMAKDIRAKLAWCKDNAAGMSFLFPDLQQIIIKPLDDFTLLIASRIDKHKADEATRLEAERARIQAEEEAKAIAKVQAAAEQQARATALAEAAVIAEQKRKDEAATHVTQSEPVTPQLEPLPGMPRPTRIQMIEAVAKEFNMTYSAAEQCMREVFAESLLTAGLGGFYNGD